MGKMKKQNVETWMATLLYPRQLWEAKHAVNFGIGSPWKWTNPDWTGLYANAKLQAQTGKTGLYDKTKYVEVF